MRKIHTLLVLAVVTACTASGSTPVSDDAGLGLGGAPDRPDASSPVEAGAGGTGGKNPEDAGVADAPDATDGHVDADAPLCPGSCNTDCTTSATCATHFYCKSCAVGCALGACTPKGMDGAPCVTDDACRVDCGITCVAGKCTLTMIATCAP